MRNARLDKLQVGIQIGRRNINNLSYAHDTTLMAESKEELKSLLMKTTIMASGPIISRQIDGEAMETVTDFIFLGSKITETVTSAMTLKDTCSLEEKL